MRGQDPAAYTVVVSQYDFHHGGGWRSALRTFLGGVRDERDDIMEKPVLEFTGPGFNVRLELDEAHGIYRASGISTIEAPVLTSSADVLIVDAERDDVERALHQLVHNGITAVCIELGDDRRFTLWKHAPDLFGVSLIEPNRTGVSLERPSAALRTIEERGWDDV